MRSRTGRDPERSGGRRTRAPAHARPRLCSARSTEVLCAMTAPKILIVGANGQIGTELAEALALQHGDNAVVNSDLAPTGRVERLAHEALDVTDAAALAAVVARHRIDRVVLLAAALSASGEKHPQWAWHLNMGGLLNVLELARTQKLQQVFWPSSIAAFGPTTPATAAQATVMDPT